jgi:peptidoglycan/LPS O-acetylase OafA/YrhL
MRNFALLRVTAMLTISTATKKISTATKLDSPSIGDVMRANGGVGPGFDTLRLSLALAIFCSHSFFASQGDNGFLWGTPVRPFLMAMVPMFFGLSGFLVTGSALRTASLQVFLTFRILRILPALVTEVTLSALILGPLLTSVSWHDYFTNREFVEYFGNIIGKIRFVLPGMFLDNPMPGIVNINLWTLKPEFTCYVIMAALILTGVIKKGRWITLSVIAVLIASFIINFAHNISENSNGGNNPYIPYVAVLYFMLGTAAFHLRDYVPIDGKIFAISAVDTYILMLHPGYAFAAAIPAMYCMLYIGMQKFPRTRLIESGDYSYGIYLYGFPIQQTLVHLFPIFREAWPLLFLVGAPLTFAFAAVSWHFIEKPTLSLKRLVGRRTSVAKRPAPAILAAQS